MSSSFWNFLWRLNIPNKIKLFMWKAILDIIPFNYNLFGRKVPISPICPICKKCEETGLHTLWNCNLSKKAWASIGWNFSNMNPISFSGLFEYVISSLTVEQVELFCYICWLFWNERNDVVHGRCTSTTVASTIEKASSLLAEFQNANEKTKSEKVNRNVKWTAPPVGFLKLNTDGAGAAGTNTRGIGGILRDEKGDLIGAFAKPLQSLLSPLATELSALKVGMVFAAKMGVAPVIVETDNIEAARLVNDHSDDWSENENIIADIKAIMPTIGAEKVDYRPRECNGAAHRLAGAGAIDAIYLNCNYYGPNWLIEIIRLDSMSCNRS